MDGCKKQIVTIGGGGINPAVIAHAITELEDNGFNVVPYEADVTCNCVKLRISHDSYMILQTLGGI